MRGAEGSVMDGMPAGTSDLSEAITKMRCMTEKASLCVGDEVWLEAAHTRRVVFDCLVGRVLSQSSVTQAR